MRLERGGVTSESKWLAVWVSFRGWWAQSSVNARRVGSHERKIIRPHTDQCHFDNSNKSWIPRIVTEAKRTASY